MKVLFTADWHLGRQTLNLDYLPYQRTLLMEWLLEEVLSKESVDLLVVAGDIFDSKHPPALALDLFSDFAAALAERSIPAVFVAGNHDLPELVSYMEGVLRRHHLYCVSAARWDVDRARLAMAPEIVVIPHLPRYRMERPVEELLEELASRYPPSEHILVLHLTVGHDGESGWEMGLVPSVDAGILRGWKLVVSGHLHGHRTLASNVVYPGSLLKYHPQEFRQRKGVLRVDTDAGTWKVIPIPQVVDMVRVSGFMAEGQFQVETVRPDRLEPRTRAVVVLVDLTRPGGDLRMPRAVTEALQMHFPDQTIHFGGVIGFAVDDVHEKGVDHDTIPMDTPRDLIRAYLEDRRFFETLQDEERAVVEDLLQEILARLEEHA